MYPDHVSVKLELAYLKWKELEGQEELQEEHSKILINKNYFVDFEQVPMIQVNVEDTSRQRPIKRGKKG